MITLIRKAIPTDLDRLMEIFSIARRFMQTTGNPNQWINGYPQRELIAQEIEADHCYAVENESGIIIATFCFIQGPDLCLHRRRSMAQRPSVLRHSSVSIRRYLPGHRKVLF